MKNIKRIIPRIAFSAYAVFMVYLLFGMRWSRLFWAPDGYWETLCGNINLIPFRTIAEYAEGLSKTANGDSVINLYGNVIMFVPLGFLLPAVFPKARPFRTCLLTALVTLCAVELIQLVTLLGSLDIDDVLLNLAGAVIGYGMWWLLSKIKRRKHPRRSVPADEIE